MAGQSAAPVEVLAGLAVYLIVVLAIGLWSSRRVRSLDDFLLGGRRLGPWVTAISERASGESAWFLMGLPGAAYAMGFREFWSVIGIAFGIFFSWVVIALPLRRGSEQLGALTLPDYFASRYPELARPLRVLSALAIVVFYVSYLGAQILGAGKLFQTLLGWQSPVTGALLGAVIVGAYTLLGGFVAVAWTDLVQGLMMAMVAVVLPVAALAHVGLDGAAAALSAARSPEFFAMGDFAVAHAAKGLGFGAVIGGLAWGVGYLGQPHLLTRYMAIERPREIRRATLIAMSWVLLAYWGVTLVGVLGVPVLGAQIADRETVVAEMARVLLPGWMAGLVIAGILAAIMSTADSQLLVATSAVVEDVIVRLLGIKLSRAQTVLLSRVVTVAITVLALAPLLSAESQRVIDGIVAYAWSGLGSTFGPALILALWWRRTSGWGVLAGMAAGFSASLAWGHVELLQEAVDQKVASFGIGLLAVVAVSALVPAWRVGEAREAAGRSA